MPSSSLIPDDPSVLLTTAGMQQFKRYYTGELDPIKDFGSKNTVSIQKCFRTSDIESVGDESHLTFFEMLGNFSFGGYFKKEAIQYAYDFFKELSLIIEFVSVFEGDKEVPADVESEKIWKSLGIADVRKFSRQDNFWGPTGKEGPCGPTTEIYVNGVEIWNLVFNEYYKYPDGHFEKLKNPGVDTGMGLERLTMVVQKKKNIFETDLFQNIIQGLTIRDERIKRVIADHSRGAVFLISDGVEPSNVERGYILRSILRRVIAQLIINKIEFSDYKKVILETIKNYGNFYKLEQENFVWGVIKKEFDDFGKAFEKGMKLFNKLGKAVSGKEAFDLHQNFGFLIELMKDLARQEGKTIDEESFQKEFQKHQEISRAGREKKFGGHGLILQTGELKAANEEELKKVTRLHTATHLLQAALRKVLGDHVHQRGSDISAERLRFDFSHPQKMTDEEKNKTEDMVNEQIQKELPMVCKEMPIEEAEKTGALMFQKEKYGAIVKVYNAGNFSKELCGGPHVQNTKEVGKFKILKEEASSAGVRRIRATVE